MRITKPSARADRKPAALRGSCTKLSAIIVGWFLLG